jgi:redox-sensitive bicupin YhaK (pirin superfamily)
MLAFRRADEIYEIFALIEKGIFYGRWHFSFDSYKDPKFTQFGTLCVFNDDTLSPGIIWPLHPHSGIDVVTYCVVGEFRHADENGAGRVLQKGWVQRTTIGIGLVHSAINNRVDESIRFIEMWFLPSKLDLEPDLQQKRVEREERSNRFLALASNRDAQALPIHAEAEVYSSYLQRDHTTTFAPWDRWGVYLYLLEGGPILVNGQKLAALDALMAIEEKELEVTAKSDAELLLVHTYLI